MHFVKPLWEKLSVSWVSTPWAWWKLDDCWKPFNLLPGLFILPFSINNLHEILFFVKRSSDYRPRRNDLACSAQIYFENRETLGQQPALHQRRGFPR
jgi:hypothetical protein